MNLSTFGESVWSNHVKSWIQSVDPRLLVVRYEDLLAQPLLSRSWRAGVRRERLTPAQAAAIERDHGAQMRRYGYLE
ncbi:MAG: hypothetical protein IIA73_10075 [Proteobacteria bacterium]|nr:hypothetical protein [Pseudomonadota bacterium]